MIEDAKDWMRDQAGKIVVCTTGALMALSLVLLGSALAGNGTEDPEARADQIIAQLRDDLEAAQADLDVEHARLLADLPGMDPERAERDRISARSVLLSLTGSSASSRSVEETQAALDARYEFLGPSSRVLAEFLPEWMAATGSDQRLGTTYRLARLEVDVTGVKALDYSYAGVARLAPVSAEGDSTAKSEHVVFTYATRQDGSMSSFEAYRASSRTRDRLLGKEPDDAATPSPIASPITTPSGSPTEGS